MEYRNTLNFVLSFSLIFLLTAIVPFINNIISMLATTFFMVKLAEWLTEVTRKYFLYKKISPKDKVILITGCDTGFGNALARRMDKLGYSVLATCLDADGEGARKLSQDCSERLTVLPMNVTDEQSIQNVKLFVQKNLERNALWAIVNNAGIAQVGQIEWTSVEEFQRVCDVNIFGVLRVTKAFLPFIKQSKGRIVNVNSVGGRRLVGGIVAYSLSKCGAIALTTGLQIELQKYGVKCISIEPFIYPTPISDMKFLSTLANKTWNAAPADIKEGYGKTYFEEFKLYYERGFSIFKNSNVFEVIDCLENAITSENPLPVYITGSLFQRALLPFLCHALPLGMTEWFFGYVLEYLGKPFNFRRKKKNN